MFFVKAQIHLYAWYFIIYFHSRYPTDENNIFEAIKYFCVTKVRCGHMSSQFAPGCEDQWQQSQQIRSQHHNSWPHHSPGVSWHCVTPPRDNQPRDSEQSSKKCWWSPQINWLERGVTTSDCIPWARRGEGCPVRVSRPGSWRHGENGDSPGDHPHDLRSCLRVPQVQYQIILRCLSCNNALSSVRYVEWSPPVVHPLRAQVTVQARQNYTLSCEGHKPVSWHTPTDYDASDRWVVN